MWRSRAAVALRIGSCPAATGVRVQPSSTGTPASGRGMRLSARFLRSVASPASSLPHRPPARTMACPFDGVRADKVMAGFCFHALEARLGGMRHAHPPEGVLCAKANVHGLFVTYETTNGDLRGCIGTFAESHLRSTLEEYALVSALKDTRFDPIAKHELPGLQCSVTILSKRQRIPRWDAWEIGRHGISLTLADGQGRRYSATFLPQVIVDQGWSKEDTFRHLLRKAGYPGRPGADVFARCEVQTYEGSKEHIPYSDYKHLFQQLWGFH